MTADERLALVRLKIERANKHILDLNAAIRVFLDSNPYEILTKRDPNTRQLIYYVASFRETPPAIGMIAGDAINNLRSSLDHLANQLYLVGTGGADYRTATSFPIASCRKEFKSMLEGKEERRKVFGMRSDAVNAICDLEPYQRGKGHDLWTLRRLNNIDKHRLLIAISSAPRSVHIGSFISKMMPLGITMPQSFEDQLFLRFGDTLEPLKAGHQLLIMPSDAEPNKNEKFRFDITLYEPGIIEGKPLLETLVQFSDRVNGIVGLFRSCLE
jgi:hypothetical protein